MTSKARSSPEAASSARRPSSSLPARSRTSGARIVVAAIWSLTWSPLRSAGVGHLSSVDGSEAPGAGRSGDDPQGSRVDRHPHLVVIADVVAVDLPRHGAPVARADHDLAGAPEGLHAAV